MIEKEILDAGNKWAKDNPTSFGVNGFNAGVIWERERTKKDLSISIKLLNLKNQIKGISEVIQKYEEGAIKGYDIIQIDFSQLRYKLIELSQ